MEKEEWGTLRRGKVSRTLSRPWNVKVAKLFSTTASLVPELVIYKGLIKALWFYLVNHSSLA